MKILNAVGLACPLPVIQTKKALAEHDQVQTIVDNEIAVQNLQKLADQLGYGFQVLQEAADRYQVVISKGAATAQPLTATQHVEEAVAGAGYLVVIDSKVMGVGDELLGHNLLKAFIYSLTEQDVPPEKLICYNGGVHLTVQGSAVLEDLLRLEELGTKIYSCGACLDFYDLTEQVAVGEITNMYHIVELMRTSARILKP